MASQRRTGCSRSHSVEHAWYHKVTAGLMRWTLNTHWKTLKVSRRFRYQQACLNCTDDLCILRFIQTGLSTKCMASRFTALSERHEPPCGSPTFPILSYICLCVCVRVCVWVLQGLDTSGNGDHVMPVFAREWGEKQRRRRGQGYRKKREKKGKRVRQRREVETRQKRSEWERGRKGGGKSDRPNRGGGLEGDCESCGNVLPRQERREQRE